MGSAIAIDLSEAARRLRRRFWPNRLWFRRESGTASKASTAQMRRLQSARPRRPAWRSPLTLRILAINVLVLAIPVLGLLHLPQYRQSLIEAELESLRTQARAFAATLANSAVVIAQDGDERLLREGTRHAMRVLLADSNVRARVFAPEGKLLADSFVLMGPGGKVTVEQLNSPDAGFLGRWPGGWVDRAYAWLVGRLPSVDDLPLYREREVQQARDYAEAARALDGEPGSRVRRDGNGGLVLSHAVPVQRYRQVLGALMVSQDGASIDAAVRDRRLDILIVFAVALGVTILLSIYLSGTIGRPIRRLADAADRIRHAKGRQVNIPDFSHRRDEIGELSVALTEMTEALWDRLDAIERFAADVAHEIKNPLTSVRSAVETVARVEDPAQQKKLIAIVLDDVQRLDRLISDISDASRLDAELSRAQSDPVDLARLLDGLVEVQCATTDSDAGPDFTLSLPEGDDAPLIVPGIEIRLAQVFRNLMSNAATFSPPDGTVRVEAHREGGEVVVTVSDDGPGIPPNKLDAIFDRFYTERPRAEKFGTHSGLGLSISRQIVDAHGGQITAENRIDAEGGIAGARFVARLPAA